MANPVFAEVRMHTLAATRAFVPLLSSEAMLSASPADAELFTHRPFGDAFAAIATTRRAQALVADIAAAPRQSMPYEEAVTKHGGMVHRIAQSIVRRSGRRGVELDDLVQEGFEGLMTSVLNFREDLGVPFAAYAYRSIHGACVRASHVARRRGLTPSHDYQQGTRPREISSVDAVDEEGVSLYDLLGEAPTQEDAIDDARALAVLRNACAKLPPRDRELFAAVFEGASGSAGGSAMSLSQRTTALCERLRTVLGLPSEDRGRTLTWKGRTLTMRQWAQDLGVAYIVLYNRAVVKGWTAARTLETPVGARQGGRPSKATRSAA